MAKFQFNELKGRKDHHIKQEIPLKQDVFIGDIKDSTSNVLINLALNYYNLKKQNAILTSYYLESVKAGVERVKSDFNKCKCCFTSSRNCKISGVKVLLEEFEEKIKS